VRRIVGGSRSARGLPLLSARLTVGVLVLTGAGALTSGGGAPAAPSPWPTARVDAEPRVTRPFLVFVTVKYVNVGGFYEERGTIWTADIDGSNRRRLAAGNVPDISPDSRWVAFLDRADRLRVVAREGGAQRLLAHDPNGFGWAPDSRRLAVLIGGSLVIIDMQTGRRVTIDRGRNNVLGFSFSPSGREIAWAPKMGELTPTLGGYDIYRASINGGNVRRLTYDQGSFYPAWGPTGIAFARFEPFTLLHPPVELWFVRPDGRTLRRISDQNLAPYAWSRDGRKLLATVDSEVDTRPYAVDPSSGKARALIRSRWEVFTAAFSSDGRRVLAVDGGRLVEVPWEGGRARVLARGVDEVADWTR